MIPVADSPLVALAYAVQVSAVAHVVIALVLVAWFACWLWRGRTPKGPEPDGVEALPHIAPGCTDLRDHLEARKRAA